MPSIQFVPGLGPAFEDSVAVLGCPQSPLDSFTVSWVSLLDSFTVSWGSLLDSFTVSWGSSFQPNSNQYFHPVAGGVSNPFCKVVIPPEDPLAVGPISQYPKSS